MDQPIVRAKDFFEECCDTYASGPSQADYLNTWRTDWDESEERGLLLRLNSSGLGVVDGAGYRGLGARTLLLPHWVGEPGPVVVPIPAGIDCYWDHEEAAAVTYWWFTVGVGGKLQRWEKIAWSKEGLDWRLVGAEAAARAIGDDMLKHASPTAKPGDVLFVVAAAEQGEEVASILLGPAS